MFKNSVFLIFILPLTCLDAREEGDFWRGRPRHDAGAGAGEGVKAGAGEKV